MHMYVYLTLLSCVAGKLLFGYYPQSAFTLCLFQRLYLALHALPPAPLRQVFFVIQNHKLKTVLIINAWGLTYE